jgi:ATP-dependent RNA helicase RhlE
LSWLPQKKQTLFFSATMPKEITNLVDSLLKKPAKVAVNPVSSPVEIIRQRLYYVDKNNKTALLADLIQEEQVSSALVFTRTKHGANKVAGDLMKRGISAAAIHGNKSQTARQAALGGFKDGTVQVLVATDIAARGLDIEELPYVFNYNLPEVPETYVHRIGRTGRAGHEGVAIAFCDFGEKPLLKEIEKLIGKAIPVVTDHAYPMVVLEAPKKDKHGRIINEEDAEARAAARERKKAREAAKQSAAQEKKKPERSATKEETAQPQSKKKSKNGGKKPAQAQETTPAREEKPAKQTRTYTRPVRTGSLEDYMKNLPQDGEEYDYSEFPLLAQREKEGGDRFVDATDRMFATHSSRYRDAYEAQKGKKSGSGKQNGKSAGKQNSEKQSAKSGADKPQAQKAKSAKGQGQKAKASAKPEHQTQGQKPNQKKGRNQTSQRGKSGNQPTPPEGRLLTVQKKRRNRDRRPPAIERPLHATQKDSTEQKSLMKPYYITKN